MATILDVLERVAEAMHDEKIIGEHLQIHQRRVATGKPGNCFRTAFCLALATDQSLVHGMLDRPPLCVDHAWVLFDDNVIVDLTQDLFCYADDFPHYIHLAHKFSGITRISAMLRLSKHYGPWNGNIDAYG